ncbi:hypothetical protein ACVWZL_003254 [Bradyrhizobium sp. GM2.4]
MAQVTAAAPQIKPVLPPDPFVATVENESSWRPDNLPVAWPAFAKLPDEKALPAKPTKTKIDSANSIVMRWEAYTAGKAKDFPSSSEASSAIKYMLTIDRADPTFPEAWASFIKLRQAAWAIAREIARLEAKKSLEKAETERKRLAKTQGVSVGMSKADVLGSSWGKPTSVNTTITAYGRHEQWVYHGSNYLYFQNERLTSIQTGR